MLARAVGRHAPKRAIRPSRLGEHQLPLMPCLCPAYASFVSRLERRWMTVEGQAQRKGTASRKQADAPKTTLPMTPSLRSRRHLATAVDMPMDDDIIPFVGMNVNGPSQIASSNFDAPSLAQIRPIGSYINLGGSIASEPQRLKMNTTGSGGDIFELVSIFRACLRVGRMERAATLLKRILSFGSENLDSQVVLQLHNQYLKAAVEQVVWNPSAAMTQALHTWFELEIRNKSLPINSDTMGYMVKAALQSLDGDKKYRLVRRYMDICRGHGNDMALQVLEMDILTAQELNMIAHICPELSAEVQGLDDVYEDIDDSLPEEVVQGTNVATSTPNVRATEQKGLGLKSLKQSLELFSNTSASSLQFSSLPEPEKRELQARLESNSVDAAIERWREENASLTKMGFNTALQSKSLGSRMWRWQVDLEEVIKKELIKVDEAENKQVKTQKDTERCVYGPFLRLITPDKLSAVTILSVMTAISSHDIARGIGLGQIIVAISGAVEDEATFDSIETTQSNLPTRKKKVDKMTAAHLRKAKRLRNSNLSLLSTADSSLRDILMQQAWPAPIKAKVGAFLMSALMETAKIPVILEHRDTKEAVTQMQPAFSHAHQYKQGKKIGTIIPHHLLVAQMKREPVHSLLAKFLPMLVTPDPWTEFGKGGFISHPAKMMRMRLGDRDQRHYAEAAIDKGDMEQTFKGLDVLGKTPWSINQSVFDVMLEAWNAGDAIANIAPENPESTIPPEPEDPSERRRWKLAVKAVENAKSGQHSQRCFQNFQLEIARSLRNEEFYFPHNIDFRGRAYPIPPYLNHMGADHCRGILMFGKGKELGSTGLRWLKIHLANVFGFDKASLHEREFFATEHMDKILESVSNPLKGTRWWLTAEDPWQFLAACFELTKALEMPDPTKFVSRLPIHQDGTCNGLQHYAALGGDVLGAKQVNLEPGDRPADVYSAVADLVRASIAEDKLHGNHYAEALEGRITRKIVKQTVMTNVYGVTYIGAKSQVKKALLGMYNDLPDEESLHVGHLASYIATKIFAALGTMFRGAHDIQFWLGECASRITQSVTPEQIDQFEIEAQAALSTTGTVSNGRLSKSKQAGKVVGLSDFGPHFKSSVIWTNPLKMPVVQPYRTSKRKIIHTNMQRICLAEPHRSNPVDKRKQLQGFPPNFIHSLDATHMLLSALRCDEEGLSFAAVHDSFWTHAGDIDAMNVILRDCFIRIHSEDVVGRVAAEFSARYKGCIYQANVLSGTTLARKIKSLRSEQRKNPKSVKLGPRLFELLEERKRGRLLASSDPAEVAEGRLMQTPAALFEEFSAEGDLETDLSGQGITLGEMRPTADDVFVDSQESSSGFEEEVDMDEVEFEDAPLGKATTQIPKSRRANPSTSKISIWLPLKFPEVPQKGTYDVSRLKDSEYFFS